ncbi:hypothetical protein Q8A73_014312 [Channa argus]|nr:hypothetical protein Q8A73_014312 [Channa argus]
MQSGVKTLSAGGGASLCCLLLLWLIYSHLLREEISRSGLNFKMNHVAFLIRTCNLQILLKCSFESSCLGQVPCENRQVWVNRWGEVRSCVTSTLSTAHLSLRPGQEIKVQKPCPCTPLGQHPPR